MHYRIQADLATPLQARGLATGWKTLALSVAATAAVLAGLVTSLPAQAAKAPPGTFPPGPIGRPAIVPLQFDVIGFIQEARLDTNNSICRATDPKLRGGTIKVNGREIVVPCNTVLQMPATSLTWAELFDSSLVDTAVIPKRNPPMTGLALADAVNTPVPAVSYPYNGKMPSYEVRVQGNIVNGRYIAGLIFISQQSLNVGQGVINCIDYTNAELHIGGAPGVCATSDTRVRINDPVGRFGKTHGKPGSRADLEEVGYDKRFTADTDNPTIKADTGYPMCIPRKNPFADARLDPVNNGYDPLCPQSNRPIAPACKSLDRPFPAFVVPADGQYCKTWVMDPPEDPNCVHLKPGQLPATGEVACLYQTDPTQQAPFVVGDYIDYLGNLKVDAKGAYVSAHTITAHLGIYTAAGTRPSYIGIEAMLQGTGSLPIANLPQEATSRMMFEGFSTDPTMMVDLYAIDVDPVTGATNDRLLGTANPMGPPVIGRFRFKPNAGAYLPATKELRAVSRGMCDGNNWAVCSMPGEKQTYWGTLATPMQFANGLTAGQYRAPNFEFIFAEATIQGDPAVPANMQDLPFLYCGTGPLTTMTVPDGTTGPLVGQLDPTPWAPPMSDPSFATVTCPTAKPVSVPGPIYAGPPVVNRITIPVLPTYENLIQNRGRINVVAAHPLTASTPGLQLYIQMATTTYDIMAGTALAINFSPSPQPMTLVKNVVGSPAVCPGPDACWIYTATGVINSPLLPGTFLAPELITITSNQGDLFEITQANMILR